MTAKLSSYTFPENITLLITSNAACTELLHDWRHASMRVWLDLPHFAPVLTAMNYSSEHTKNWQAKPHPSQTPSSKSETPTRPLGFIFFNPFITDLLVYQGNATHWLCSLPIFTHGIVYLLCNTWQTWTWPEHKALCSKTSWTKAHYFAGWAWETLKLSYWTTRELGIYTCIMTKGKGSNFNKNLYWINFFFFLHIFYNSSLTRSKEDKLAGRDK